MAGKVRINKGILYKKILNKDGTVKEKIPTFLKTLASLVITSEGKSVDTKLNELDNKKTYFIYDTYADYMRYWNSPDHKGMYGENLCDALVIVLKDDINDI